MYRAGDTHICSHQRVKSVCNTCGKMCSEHHWLCRKMEHGGSALLLQMSECTEKRCFSARGCSWCSPVLAMCAHCSPGAHMCLQCVHCAPGAHLCTVCSLCAHLCVQFAPNLQTVHTVHCAPGAHLCLQYVHNLVPIRTLMLLLTCACKLCKVHNLIPMLYFSRHSAVRTLCTILLYCAKLLYVAHNAVPMQCTVCS